MLALRSETLCDWNADAKSTSTSSHFDDEEMRVRIKRDDCLLDIDARGEIEFNEAETDVLVLSPSGYIEIEERAGRSRRRLEIRAVSGGEPDRRWFVDGDERSYDGDAREWLAGILPVIFRVTGIQAQERAARILVSQGVDGLLQEISLIRSDYVAGGAAPTRAAASGPLLSTGRASGDPSWSVSMSARISFPWRGYRSTFASKLLWRRTLPLNCSKTMS